MASREAGHSFFVLRCLEHYSDGQGNEARGATAGVDAVVARLDESLEARAQRNLDAATDIPPEVILGAGSATTVEACAWTIQTDSPDRVGSKGHAQGQVILHVSGERGNVYAPAAIRESELVVRGFRAQGYRHRLRLVADFDRDVVAGIGSSAQITCRECNPTCRADLEWIVTLTLRDWRRDGESQDCNRGKNSVFHCCSNCRREYFEPARSYTRR